MTSKRRRLFKNPLEFETHVESRQCQGAPELKFTPLEFETLRPQDQPLTSTS